jgi:CheY-like chemotaxis protein
MILVIEDDPDIRESLKELLEGEGYRVSAVANGRDGLEAIGREIPSLIFLDLMMPVMDGKAFVQELQEKVLVGSPQIPIVILTAAGDRSYPPPVAEVIQKPVDVTVLLQLARKYAGE